jgi:hypothetical protein
MELRSSMNAAVIARLAGVVLLYKNSKDRQAPKAS